MQLVVVLSSWPHRTPPPPARPHADAVHDQGEEMDLSGVDLPFRRLDMPLQNVSATAVRAQVGQPVGRSSALEVLVPEAVASYISQHFLYQKPS